MGKVQGEPVLSINTGAVFCWKSTNTHLHGLVNITKFPGDSQIAILSITCCECRRPIRSNFYRCSELCVHHDPGSQTACAVARHQYCVCAKCYLTCAHTKHHLRKTRPYDPLSGHVEPPLTDVERVGIAKDINRLRKHEDAREDKNDGKGLLRTASLVVPGVFQKWILPRGNVHASIGLGPLVFEIGAQQ